MHATNDNIVMKRMSAWVIHVVMAVITMMLVVSSCNNDDGDSSPTTPSVPDPFVSLQEDSEYSKEFWGEPVDHGFEANIPEAGDYRFVYTTNLGTFNLMFRASSPVVVIVDILPEHQIQKLILQKGTLVQSAAASRLQTVEVIQQATFKQDKAFGDLLLINGGNAAIPKPLPTATPTPKPTPTPTPRPTRPAGHEVRIVAVGDSITYGVGGTNDEGYPPKLEALLWKAGKNVTVSNAGVPGEKSPETDDRFSREIRGADIVLLMIGTNDVTHSGICYGAPCLTDTHIASMLDKALNAGVTPIVSTIIPFSGYEEDDAVRELNQQIKSVASQRGVSVVDNYRKFSEVGFSVYYNRLHPDDEGYEIMAEEWYKTVIRKL